MDTRHESRSQTPERRSPVARQLCRIGLALLLAASSAAADIVINEFMAKNDTVYANALGAFEDWIELYNGNTTSVDMAGWYLTDNAENRNKWMFPTNTPELTVLAAHGYMIVVADGNPSNVVTGQLHADFSLKANDNEDVVLVDPSLNVVHAYLSIPEQYADRSYGIGTSQELRYFDVPTPGLTNNAGFTPVAIPTFYPPRGIYSNSISVALTSQTAGASIRYTTDGTPPSETQGTLYSGALTITNTTCIRAMAYKVGDYKPLTVMTHTYLFLNDVVTQPAHPPGFPVLWDNTGTANDIADYEMDPEIVTNSAYAPLMIDALKSLPVMSLVTDVDHLFDYGSGIYANPLSQGVGWERPVSMELFHPDGSDDIQVNCGLRIYGGASRNPDFPKHTLRLLFKSDYGPTKLRYDLFGHDPFGSDATDSFDTIILRGGHNNTWTHRRWGQCYRAQYTRDQWMRDNQLAMGHPAAHGTFVHLYINGLYWGIYNPAERPNAAFQASYMGGDREDYDAQNVNQAVDGNLAAWNTMIALAGAGLADNSKYQAIQQYLDVPNLIDYMLVNFYAGTDDWDNHNWYAGRRREAGAGYRFFNWDSEFAIARHTTDGTPIQGPGILDFDNTGKNNANCPSHIYTKLRANAEFRLLFADHVHRHFFNDGLLTPSRAAARWQTRAAQLHAAVVAESARWGDYKRDVNPGWYPSSYYALFDRDDEYLTHQQWILNEYFPQRTAIVVDQLRARNLYPSIEAPVLSQHGGAFSNTLTLTLSASDTIYYTLDGSDPREYGTSAILGQAYIAPLVLDQSVLLKARAYNGVEWSALTEALFTELPLPKLQITEVMYHPRAPTPAETLAGFTDSDFEFIEILNAGPNPVGLAGLHFSRGILFDFNKSELLSLSPGAYLLVVKNLNAFTNRYANWATMNIAGEYQTHDYFDVRTLSNSGEKLTLEDGLGNTLANFTYNDRQGWPLAADGAGHSLVPSGSAYPKAMKTRDP